MFKEYTMTLMKKAAAVLAMSLLANIAMNAQAGLFDDLKDKLKKETKKEAAHKVDKEVKKKVKHSAKSNKSSSKSSSKAKKSSKAGRISLGNGPSSDLISMTNCAGLTLSNVMTGYVEDYTFQQGFSKETRSGLIKRQPVTVKNGCILPSLQPNQAIYMEVDTKEFKALGSSNDWSMQCVRSAKPGDGALTEKENKTEAPYHTDVLTGKDMMLFCGNSEGVSECAEGSNSQRGSKWKKKLKSKGKTMLGLRAHTSTLAPAGGEKIFCQYYNKKKNSALFAFEYLRVRQ
jgi:hypothetical protein